MSGGTRGSWPAKFPTPRETPTRSSTLCSASLCAVPTAVLPRCALTFVIARTPPPDVGLFLLLQLQAYHTRVTASSGGRRRQVEKGGTVECHRKALMSVSWIELKSGRVTLFLVSFHELTTWCNLSFLWQKCSVHTAPLASTSARIHTPSPWQNLVVLQWPLKCRE